MCSAPRHRARRAQYHRAVRAVGAGPLALCGKDCTTLAARIAPHLPPPQTVMVVQGLHHTWHHHRVAARIAPHLPPPQTVMVVRCLVAGQGPRLHACPGQQDQQGHCRLRTCSSSNRHTPKRTHVAATKSPVQLSMAHSQLSMAPQLSMAHSQRARAPQAHLDNAAQAHVGPPRQCRAGSCKPTSTMPRRLM